MYKLGRQRKVLTGIKIVAVDQMIANMIYKKKIGVRRERGTIEVVEAIDLKRKKIEIDLREEVEKTEMEDIGKERGRIEVDLMTEIDVKRETDEETGKTEIQIIEGTIEGGMIENGIETIAEEEMRTIETRKF